MQLALNLSLNDEATFSNFYISDENKQLVDALKLMTQNTGEQFTYFWSEPEVGRTHLLQACCHRAIENNLQAAFIPLGESKTLSPEMLQGLAQFDLVCIDNVDHIAGDSAWQEALFHFYNQLRDNKRRLIVTAASSPTSLDLQLADLRSRLSSGVSFQLRSLTDPQKCEALQMRASKRGLVLSEEVAHFLLAHCPRNPRDLFAILESLDKASLAAQRRLTIPFVKLALSL